MEKIEILKTRDFRGTIGLKDQGEIVEVESGLAQELVERGDAKKVAEGRKSYSKVKTMQEERQLKEEE